VNHVEISRVDEKTSPLSEDEHGVLFKYGIDEKQSASSHAQIPESQRDYTLAFLFTRDPLNEEPAEKESLADKAQSEQIIVLAIADEVADCESIQCETNQSMFPILQD
jgi:hypothetical protein